MWRPSLVLVSALALAGCGKPNLAVLRQQPSPKVFLEISLPDGPDQAEARKAYDGAFREQFGGGLSAPGEPAAPDRIQLLVVIGQRAARSEAESQRNTAVDQASAVATANPLRLLHSALGPKSAYDEQAERLGYRPVEPKGRIILMQAGPGGFQETITLAPLAVLKRMRPLGESDRASGGPLMEEGRAVALETLAILQTRYGWAPGRP